MVPCKGVFHQKFSELHADRAHGTTTAKKLWENRQVSDNTYCTCCTSYEQWKLSHPQQFRLLLEAAKESVYYKAFPSEEISIKDEAYTGTIRALSGGPLGACLGVDAIHTHV